MIFGVLCSSVVHADCPALFNAIAIGGGGGVPPIEKSQKSPPGPKQRQDPSKRQKAQMPRKNAKTTGNLSEILNRPQDTFEPSSDLLKRQAKQEEQLKKVLEHLGLPTNAKPKRTEVIQMLSVRWGDVHLDQINYDNLDAEERQELRFKEGWLKDSITALLQSESIQKTDIDQLNQNQPISIFISLY